MARPTVSAAAAGSPDVPASTPSTDARTGLSPDADDHPETLWHPSEGACLAAQGLARMVEDRTVTGSECDGLVELCSLVAAEAHAIVGLREGIPPKFASNIQISTRRPAPTGR